MNKEIERFISEISDKDLLACIRNNFMMINTFLLKGKKTDAMNSYNKIVNGLKDYFGNSDSNNSQVLTNSNAKIKKLGVHPAMGNRN